MVSEVGCHSSKWHPGYEPTLEAFVSGGKTFVYKKKTCKYVLDLIYVDNQNGG